MPARNRPNIGYDRAGPTQFERIFQDNTVRPGPEVDLNFLRNLQQGPGVIDRTIRDRTPSGEGVIKPKNPALPPWYNNNIGEGSFWNAGYIPQDNTGIMTATDYSPDFKGRWLLNSPWGHRLLGLITNRHADEGTLEGLDQGGNGGFLGAEWDFDIGKNNFGVNATWSLGG